MERKVDVIIPTYHPDDKFRVLMRMLRRQTCPIHKIIVMNTGDVLKDEEHYMLHSAKHNVKLEVNPIPPEEFDHGGTRNAAAMASTADILVFLTQDAVPGGRISDPNASWRPSISIRIWPYPTGGSLRRRTAA